MAELVFQSMQTNSQAVGVRQHKAVLHDNRATRRELAFADNRTAQLNSRPNNTGLPDNLKSGIEHLSGMSMDHVRVHYNSSQPAQLNALAYAQGSNIHIAPGQEKHLPHEAWHVVQQAQGRVKPTMQAKGVAINDNQGLEREADVMGGRASQTGLEAGSESPVLSMPGYAAKPVQRLANKHGLTMPQYQVSTGWTVLGWGRLTGPGIVTNLNAVSAGALGHAEDQLIVQATGILAAAAPGAYTNLEIWISSSPCSTAFGTRVGVLSGCLEELQNFAVLNGLIVRVHAQKPYQPRGLGPGMKQSSVNAANGAGANVPHDFDNRTGVAAGLTAYVAPVGLPGGLGTVAQLSGVDQERKPKKLATDAEEEKTKKTKGKVIVTYE